MLGLDAFLADHGAAAVAGVALAFAAGGFAKGVVGFALPLIAVSVAGSFLPCEVAVALLVVPTPVSAWMVPPTLAAMFAGYRIHDRLDQDRFRKVTLAVLVVTGLNLLRRALLRDLVQTRRASPPPRATRWRSVKARGPTLAHCTAAGGASWV